jgi:hypothetical protein
MDSCRIPARTPGALGINDQADPNLTTLLGDTPGSLGVCDWADPNLRLYTPADPYADMMCRADDGTAISRGFDGLKAAPAAAPSTTAADYISLAEAQEMALKITTTFEGSTMDYQSLAGDELDGMGMSFGLIQWNFGSNTLGPVLKKMLDKDSAAFAACFGSDTDYDTLKTALGAKKQADELKWARDLQKKNRTAWEAAFKKVGANEKFKKIQLEEAVGKYHRNALGVIKEIRDISPTLFQKVEFRSYAAIFDLCVQQGSLHEPATKDKDGNKVESHQALDQIKSRVQKEKPASQIELMKIVVAERGATGKAEWIPDCVSRRMGVLIGSPYQATHGEKKAKRSNSQFSLITKFGTKYVQDL